MYYTVQRGEAFIGNRTHVIKDRNLITKEYNEVLPPLPQGTTFYSPNNPNLSSLMTSVETPPTPTGPTFQGTFQEPDINDISFTK